MPILKDLRSVSILIQTLKKYAKLKMVTPGDYVNGIISTEEVSKRMEDVYASFLVLTKHETFLRCITEKYLDYSNVKILSKEIPVVLFYSIIFELDEGNLENTQYIFKNIQFNHAISLVNYFLSEDNQVEIVQCGCKYFGNDYVLNKILYPIFFKFELIQKIYEDLIAYSIKKNRRPVKPPTKSITPACLARSKFKKAPTVPLNTPNHEQSNGLVISNTVPQTTYNGPESLQKKIVEDHENNRKMALELLEYARNNVFAAAREIESRTHESPSPSYPVFKASKPPDFNKIEISVRNNAASLMREAAVVLKDKKDEIKRLEILTQSFFDPTVVEDIERNIRECKEQQHLQDIERKHLQGLITYEDAILAKNNLLKENRQRMEEFKRERKAILDEIEHWRLAEQEKIRALVEKCREAEENVKEVERRVLEEKQANVRLMNIETKELLNEAYIRKQEELAKKVRLIQELRAFELVRNVQVKEFDPTETPNFGLLCEMSIAELQKRLDIVKLEIREELEKRRKAIAESRLKQQQLIEDIKQFIDQSKRDAKAKIVPRSSVKLEQTPEIIALRKRLQQARQARINTQNSSTHTLS